MPSALDRVCFAKLNLVERGDAGTATAFITDMELCFTGSLRRFYVLRVAEPATATTVTAGSSIVPVLHIVTTPYLPNLSNG